MYDRKEAKTRYTTQTITGETEMSVEVVMRGMTDKQEDRVRELLKAFWGKAEQIAAEQEVKV